MAQSFNNESKAELQSASNAYQLDQELMLNNYGRIDLHLCSGKGSWLYGPKNEKYLDFISGISVNSLGHCPDVVVDAIKKQAERLIHTSNLFPIEAQLELARFLLELSGKKKVFFCNSGTEANEAAIKFARKYFFKLAQTKNPSEKNIEEKGRTQIISFKQSFHGRTYGGLSATGQDSLKLGFGPMLSGFDVCTWNQVEELKQLVSEQTCAIMLEPIAVEGGILTPSPEFIACINQLRKEFGLLVIADEIQVGLGRTGDVLSSNMYGLETDLITLAKPLGAGLPLGAVLLSEQTANSIGPGDHGSTFGGNPIACAAGLALLKVVCQKDFLQEVRRKSALLRAELQKFSEQYEFLGEIRGEGFILGITCEKPLPDVLAAARSKGLLIARAGTNLLRVLPPLNVSEEEIKIAVNKLSEVFKSFC